MTLQPYDGARLDQLSLRLLDVVSQLRTMAATTREGGLEKIVLHDRKPLEWIARLEAWAQHSASRAQVAALRQAAHRPATPGKRPRR
jgi:hypothetical protein